MLIGRENDGRLRILVLGYLVRGPLGGLAWHHFQYVLGLHRMGHEVWFLEDSGDYPACYDPSRQLTDADPSYGLAFTQRLFQRHDLQEQWAYYDAHAGRWLGPAAGRLPALCASADLLLNISGINPLRPWVTEVPVRALIDTDPAFVQVRHLTDPDARTLADQHTHFFTFAENYGLADCTVPDDGYPWQPTRQPVVLDCWEATAGPADGRYTTVMQWDSYAKLEFQGRRFGMKAESFDPYVGLPGQVGGGLELALGSPNAPRDLLIDHGWHLRDPFEVTRDPWVYQDYLRSSKAEFSVAKHGYVATHSGWFSERSACYLASGRPALVQDTGFSRHLPTGEGLLTFTMLDEAVAGLEAINADYMRHCTAARALAEEQFNADQVLEALLEHCAHAPESGQRQACTAESPAPDLAVDPDPDERTPCVT